MTPQIPDSIEQACFWLARRAPRGHTPLAGAREADVAVVGAGLTGLWTALFLKELDPALEVAVVEQGLAAHGASGRNAGMLSETVDHGHALAIEHFGEAEARRLARLGETNVAEMTAFLAERDIRCDYEPTGRLMVALTPAQVEEARRTVATAERLGLASFHLLDREAIQAEVHSPLYLGGVRVTGGGILDPVKLVDGLRGEAERRGVRVFERSRVAAVERAGAAARVGRSAGSSPTQPEASSRNGAAAASAVVRRGTPACSAGKCFVPRRTRTVTVVPWFTVLVTSMVPPCSFTSSCTSESPMPEPSAVRAFVVWPR